MTTQTNTDKKPATIQWKGAFDAFGAAFEQLKSNPGPAVLYAVVYLLIVWLEAFGPGPGGKESLTRATGYETLAYLIFLLALPTYGLAIARRKRLEIADFMRFDARKYLYVLAVSILYGLIVAGSLLLLILPAIWTIAWFALCVMLVIDQNLKPIAALKESKRLIQDHKGKVWGVIGVTILFSIGAGFVMAIPLIGLLVGSLLSALIAVLSTSVIASLYLWARQQKK